MSKEKIMVLGMGTTGLSCIRLLCRDYELLVSDTRLGTGDALVTERVIKSDFPDIEVVNPVNFVDRLDGISRVIASPGIASDHDLLRSATKLGIPVLGDIDLFMERANAPVYAVTGTNGKSTTTALAGAMCESSGIRYGGNLGTPALDLLDPDAEGYLLELSSFQLERTHPCRFEIAAMLNFAADHIDRHGSVERYLACKRRIYRDCAFAIYNGQEPCTKPPDSIPGLAINSNADWRISERWIVINGQSVDESDIAIKGRHNRFNAVAASAIALQAGVPLVKVKSVLATFAGLPHRTQTIESSLEDGVAYVNDSKSTNVGSAVAAIAGVAGGKRRVILLAGGDGKNTDFTPLKNPVQRFVKRVVLYGRDGPIIESTLQGLVPIDRFDTFKNAVEFARDSSTRGDIVLLSPACASYDEFCSYGERGTAFSKIVRGPR